MQLRERDTTFHSEAAMHRLIKRRPYITAFFAAIALSAFVLVAPLASPKMLPMAALTLVAVGGIGLTLAVKHAAKHRNEPVEQPVPLPRGAEWALWPVGVALVLFGHRLTSKSERLLAIWGVSLYLASYLSRMLGK